MGFSWIAVADLVPDWDAVGGVGRGSLMSFETSFKSLQWIFDGSVIALPLIPVFSCNKNYEICWDLPRNAAYRLKLNYFLAPMPVAARWLFCLSRSAASACLSRSTVALRLLIRDSAGVRGLMVLITESNMGRSCCSAVTFTGVLTTESMPSWYCTSNRAWVVLSANTTVLTNCPPTFTTTKYLFMQIFSSSSSSVLKIDAQLLTCRTLPWACCWRTQSEHQAHQPQRL